MKPWDQMTLAERQAHNDAMAARRESMKTDPLLPCPFCGNAKPERRTEYDYIRPGEMAPGSSGGHIAREYVACHQCGARHQSPNPDAPHWNMRAPATTNT